MNNQGIILLVIPALIFLFWIFLKNRRVPESEVARKIDSHLKQHNPELYQQILKMKGVDPVFFIRKTYEENGIDDPVLLDLCAQYQTYKK